MIPAAGAVMLRPIEPSGCHRWEPGNILDDGPTTRDPYPERDFAIQFARGSQPESRFDQAPVAGPLAAEPMTPMTLSPNEETRIAPVRQIARRTQVYSSPKPRG